MTATTSKTLSMGVVGVMVGYCCWPYIFGPDHGPAVQQAESPPAIAASVLMPALEPAPDRDPFRAVPPPKVVARESIPPVHDDADAESDSDTGTEAGRESEPDRLESLGPLALNATFVRGDQRVALINGRVYAAGDPLADSGASTTPFVVSEIFADKVVIERKGQTTELAYPGLTATSQSSSLAGAKVSGSMPIAVPSKTGPNKHGSSAPKKAPNCNPTKGPSRP